MSEKDLAEELERLKAENKKLKQKLKPKESYVLEQVELFDQVFNLLQEFPAKENVDEDGMKYFFVRKPRKKKDSEKKDFEEKDPEELVFKLNLFVKHLMEYKVRLNKKISEEKKKTRLSMDIASLISSLQEGRVKRPRRAGKGIDTKPTKKPKTKAKKGKEKPDLPNHPEVEMKAKLKPLTQRDVKDLIASTPEDATAEQIAEDLKTIEQMEVESNPAVRSMTIEEASEKAGGKDWQKNGPSFG